MIYLGIMAERKPITLFDNIDYRGAENHLRFRGTIADVFADIERTLAAPDRDKLTKIAYHPVRVLEAIINYKIANPNLQNPLTLIQSTADMLLHLHLMNQTEFTAAKQTLCQSLGSNHPLFGKYPNVVPQMTWYESYNENRPSDSAGRLLKGTSKRFYRFLSRPEPVLLLLIGQAGYTGLDVFARYLKQGGHPQSLVYPFRYSAYKYGDKQPRLTKEELAFIAESSRTRTPVLFDTFHAEGRTIQGALCFFDQFFQDQRTLFLYNKLDPVDHWSTDSVGRFIELEEKQPATWDYLVSYLERTQSFRKRILT